jgi:hypothetical protein
MNVYNNANSAALFFLRGRADLLPIFTLVAGDFNLHSSVWDNNVPHHCAVPIMATDLMADLGVHWICPANHGPTHLPHNRELCPSVIDLVFGSFPDEAEEGFFLPTLRSDLIGRLDHVLLAVNIPFGETDIRILRRTVPPKSVEEDEFLGELGASLGRINVEALDSPERIDEVASAISSACSEAWDHHLVEKVITTRSKSWWNKECGDLLRHHRRVKTPQLWRDFQAATRRASRAFFDSRIEDIAVKSRRPWDLMEWTKPRKLPACEAISYSSSKNCPNVLRFWTVLAIAPWDHGLVLCNKYILYRSM